MNFDLEKFLVGLLKTPTKRDLQTKVGPSGLGNLCTRCLADDLLRTVPSEPGKFWLGAVIGTAIHEEASRRLNGNSNVLSEFEVFVADIPGYGSVRGTTDLYIKSERASVDFKGTTRKKLSLYKRLLGNKDTSLSLASERFKVNGYINQLMLYGRGLENAGLPVKTVNIAFIARDGTGDNDIWCWGTAYDPARAQQVIDRATQLWNWLQEGNDPETLPSVDGCFTCEVTREKRIK